jgi:hypothetical protein
MQPRGGSDKMWKLAKMIFTTSGAQVYHPLHILGWRFSAAPTKNTVVQYYLSYEIKVVITYYERK